MHSIFHERKRSSRSRSRERIEEAVDSDLVLMPRAQREGNVQSRKQTKFSKRPLDSAVSSGVRAEENSFDLELRQSSSRKASRTSMKALIDKEMSKGTDVRRSSPSLVARLMGLDALPPVVPKRQKEKGSNYQKPSVGLPKNYTDYEDYPFCTSTNEYEECKDVFEVMEMPKAEKQNNEPYSKGKQSEIRKIINANSQSTDDEFEYSKEYDDVMEDLDPNKDLFLKFLQQPNPLFKKHLHDLNCDPPSPHASHITVLKPSKATALGNEFFCISERRSRKYHETLYTGKNKDHLHHTQIVVLKPSFEKAFDMATTVPLGRSSDCYHYGLKKQKQKPMSRRSEVYLEARGRHKLSDGLEVMGHKTKGLREIAREITKQLRTDGSSSSYINDESSRGKKGKLNLELFGGSSHHFNDYSDSLSASSYYSTESLVSKEARKCLSERWKMTHQIHEMGTVDRGSSTLEEMLVFDRERPKTSRNKLKNISTEKVAKDEALARWEDGWSRSLPRSKSLPSSSLVYENNKAIERNKFGGSYSSYAQNAANTNKSLDGIVSQKRNSSVESLNNHHIEGMLYSGREDDELSEREIHVNSEELKSSINVRQPDEEMSMISEIPTHSVASRSHESGNLVTQCKDVKFSSLFDAQQVQQSTKLAELANVGEFSCTGPKHGVRKESSMVNPQIPSHCEISESPSPISSKEADQPSPVSVLDPPQDKSSSESFEKISADLKELRMQLKLLKLGSADSDTEDLELHISSDDDTEECHSPHKLEQILRAFRDDEDRDFSYVLDILIDSGVHRTNGKELISVGTDVFEKLEKKYNVMVSWSRSERKLLFDLTSSIFASIMAPPISRLSMRSRRYHPSFARESLVEEVWQMVVKQRKEMSGKLEERLLLEPRWLDSGDNVNMIGREIESELIEDLIKEFTFQLISE